MNHNNAVKTSAYIAGMLLLFLILIAVLGIMSGIIPVRERAEAPEDDNVPVNTVTSTPAPPPPTVTESTPPLGETVDIPEMTLDEEEQIYAVNVTYSRGGTVTPSGMTTVVKGGSITLTILPDENYMVESVTVNGETVQTGNELTLSDVHENCSVYVSFSHIPDSLPENTPVSTPEQGEWNPFASPTPPQEE